MAEEAKNEVKIAETITPADARRKSLIITMANKFGLEPGKLHATLQQTIFPKGATNENVIAFMIVANQYNLNPFTREIFAFPTKDGGVQPIVGVDGWAKIINDHPQFDGMEFEFNITEKGALDSVECSIWRKDRSKPIRVTEFLAECYRKTPPWMQWPRRMLRHKATIQAARLAFGFSGIVDEDEAERMKDVGVIPPEVSGKFQQIKDKLQKQIEPPAKTERPPVDDAESFDFGGEAGAAAVEEATKADEKKKPAKGGKK